MMVAMDILTIASQKGGASKTTLADGHTVGEINPRSRSAEEMAAFWQHVTTQLRRQNRSL